VNTAQVFFVVDKAASGQNGLAPLFSAFFFENKSSKTQMKDRIKENELMN
jgi:hypothetical protein